MKCAQRGVRIAVLSLFLILAGCGGQPTRIADPGSGASPASARKSTVVQKRGGGYYKDDGPADDIPDNLDDIPDAQPQLEPLHRFANRPYEVLGKSYVPNTRLKPVRQRGIASWYGKKFHGQKTSIGETYDMFAMTAAHPTLALPSYVRVTNVGNGRTVIVRVNDRGPFHADRIIDLSYAAAHRLGYVNNGSTLVEVEAMLPTGPTSPLYAEARQPPLPVKPPAPPADQSDFEQLMAQLAVDGAATTKAADAVNGEARGLFLQLGAFSNADNAESLRSHLARELDWLGEGIQIQASGGIHRVHLGPYPSRSDAERVAERIRLALGYKPTFVTR
ncbi:septal ring lytic transglycosylase RlpA family protein [Propionivibrio sp.]|uniref:septal ring lytic transglycosylase RlpA family protein n=1 Tax=Propionivibrio sp. TaxID=2212460 RepID=UPI00272E6385|nr:septal ring lytic transglycosylase RlpA family protein [Propionivibrio sp.]